MEMKSEANRRSGVAVIIVLGMLALLMMMGVAFSVSMRTERRSAGNYSNDVSTKNLVWAGLAEAVRDLDDAMVADDVPYPLWEALWTSNGITQVSLGQGEAAGHVPGVLASWSTNTASWLIWERPGSGGMPTPFGRYAYVILNTSGLLDANFSGGEDRGGGTNVNEIKVEEFPSILNPANLTRFKNDRKTDVWYESLQELEELNSGIANNTDFFTTYSRFPLDDDLISLVGTESELEARRVEIEAKLRAEVRFADAPFIFNSLLDYIDEDSIPHNNDLAEPYVERVPMINEVWVDRLTMTVTPTACTLSRPDFAVELVYPFVEVSSESFAVEIDVSSTIVDANGIVIAGPQIDTYQMTTTAGSAPESYRMEHFRERSYSVVADLTGGAVLPVQAQIKIGCRVLITSDGNQVVDAVPYPTGTDGLPFTISATVASGDMASWECVDPRFNWLVPSSPTGRRNHWVEGVNGATTAGQVNQATLDMWALNPRDTGYDTHMQMRVSNREELMSVGELGHILRSRSIRYRFNTIRLYDMGSSQRDGILDGFTVETNGVQRGVINLNAAYEDIILAGFEDAPRKYPESGQLISLAGAEGIRDYIMDDIDADGFYEDIAEMCDSDWAGIAGLGGYTDLERESIIAHSCRLLGVRQNLFTIIVGASPAAAGMGSYAQDTRDLVLSGDKRAVFQVWRDPVVNADGRHECFVRFFKWLEN
ncbi:MAG: hypothetical protein HN341_01210 [Verrucomicrobia bacterium]|nr:hypothetical protein [Verrucomicrobiota bacterium]